MTVVAPRSTALAPVVLLLTGIGWATAAQGGSRAVDLALLSALLLAALGASRVGVAELLRALRSRPALSAGALVVWTAVVGLATAGPGTAALRLPVLVLLVAVAAVVVDRMSADERVVLLAGVVVIGVVVAVSAVLGWFSALAAGAELPIRAATLLGYPNAAGAVMLAAGAACVHLWRTGRVPRVWGCAGVGVLSAGVLVTGSRLALGVALAGLVVAAWRARSRWGVVAAAAAALPVVGLLAQRFATSQNERVYLWGAALREVVSGPVTGRGPAPVLVPGLPDAKPTTHAHNELLQLGLEYGTVGMVLGLVCLGTVVALLVRRVVVDPVLLLGCAALGGLGLTDFALRFPAVALVLTVLVVSTWRPATPGPDGSEPISAGKGVVTRFRAPL
jgi:hypothetical protein